LSARLTQAIAGQTNSEIAAKADFTTIRYAQCWEDADILLEALNVQAHHVCLSIASAGDNTLAILSRGPQRVIAVDLSPAQIACLELRVAAYRRLDYDQALELIGARPSARRPHLYALCRPGLSMQAQAFWDARAESIAAGFGNAGKFERYLRLFGTHILPLLQSKATLTGLLQPRSQAERERFYDLRWDNWRWRAAFRLFFSRRVMGLLGRDPHFFQYVTDDVAAGLLARTRYALTVLDPVENPYLQWIVLGRHGPALPYALRAENFQAIRANLDRLEWRCQPLEETLADEQTPRFDCFNLSDVFEYMSQESYADLLRRICERARPQARLAYWNMMVPRRRPESLAAQLRPLTDLAAALYRRDKAFFYRDFVVEEVM